MGHPCTCVVTCICLVCLPDHEVGAVAVHHVALGSLPQGGDVHVGINPDSEQSIYYMTLGLVYVTGGHHWRKRPLYTKNKKTSTSNQEMALRLVLEHSLLILKLQDAKTVTNQ